MTEENLAAPGAGGAGEIAGEAAATAGTAGEGGNWLESLPEDLRGNPTLGKYKSPEEAYKGLVNLAELVGRKRAVPAEDAPQEEWDAFYTDLGRPEAPDKYELAPPADFPAELIDPDLEQGFREMAHKYGLNQRTAKGIYDDYLKLLGGKMQALQQAQAVARESSEAELQGEWGDKFEANLNLAKSVIRTFLDPKLQEALDHGPGTMFPDLPAKAGDPIFNNPLLVRFLVKVGQAMGENVLVKGAPAGASAANLQTQANELMASEPYMDGSHPDHKRVVAQVKELYQKMHPEVQE